MQETKAHHFVKPRRANASGLTRKISPCVVALLVSFGGCTGASTSDSADVVVTEAMQTGRGEAAPFAGYTLFQPLESTSVYLVDMNGELVHTWATEYNTGQSVYLLENGHLLRAASDPDPRGVFGGGGEGGIVQEIAWDGTVVWEYKFSDETRRHHHDIAPMPNGNVLLIAWEGKTQEEAIAAGIDPSRMEDEEIWPDFIVEVEPVRPDGGNIVWEWHAWDHLVQEYDPAKANYGVVAEHPELIDINAAPAHEQRQQMAAPEEVARLRALGYIGGSAEDELPPIESDWMHTNAIDYNAQLDQILLSVRHFSELWVIDHSTTTEEAAGHTGGRSGKGGDLLYRWGNPQAYSVGTAADRRRFGQHDTEWIPEGYPGAGNILLFNNGEERPEGEYSSVDEIVPPIDARGRYVLPPLSPAPPTEPIWSYSAEDRPSMFADIVSGSQRLPNGNTLIAVGVGGRIFEVGANNAVVWEFVNPYLEEEGPRTERDRDHDGDDNRDGGDDGDDDRNDDGGGGPTPGSIYRATRIAPDHPGLANLNAGTSGAP